MCEVNVIERDLRVKDASSLKPLEDLSNDFATECSVTKTTRPRVLNPGDLHEKLARVIDALGEASAAAQEIPAAVTTTDKLTRSRHRVYILVEPTVDGTIVVGLLKVGFKQLFLRDERCHLRQVRALCLLDFYVHESRQRRGCGRRLFDCMARTECLSPAQLPIDHPSAKLLAFMGRHFGLEQVIPQNNHFAVFRGFFDGTSHSKTPLPVSPQAGRRTGSPRNRSRNQGRPPVGKRSRTHSLDSSLVGSCLEWAAQERNSQVRRSVPPRGSHAWQTCE